MIMKHWLLETRLAGQILRSSVKSRSETIRRSYKLFYNELKWLNDSRMLKGISPISQREESVIHLIGKKRKHILEVGSGNGELIDYLSRHGHECIGTDINTKRFKAGINPHLQVRAQNGVAIEDLFQSAGFDTVVSLNVLEHFHPDDMEGHFHNVFITLKRGGEYILKTPHRFFGPHGIERVFGITRSRGLHLKEYTYGDIREFSDRSGFHRHEAVLMIPMPIRRIVKKMKMDCIIKSRYYMDYLMLIERIIETLPGDRNRRRASGFFRFFLFPRQVFVVLTK